MSLERFKSCLVENLRNQAHVFVDDDVVTVTDGNARRFLSAVLQRIQTVVGEFGNFVTRSPHSKDPAGVLGSLLAREQIMGEASVTAGHGPSLRV